MPTFLMVFGWFIVAMVVIAIVLNLYMFFTHKEYDAMGKSWYVSISLFFAFCGFLVMMCLCSGCNLFPKANPGVEIKPGKYNVTQAEQHFTCSDGTDQTDADVSAVWTITHDNNEWKLFLTPDLNPTYVMSGRENGTGLLFTATGTATIPGICNYPMTLTADLTPSDEGFDGTMETDYNLVTCSNGNAGTCAGRSILTGVLIK